MKTLKLVLLPVLLAACAGPDVHQYQHKLPSLDPLHYFIGATDAWGMFQQRDGTVLKRFHVSITGTQLGDELQLDERFDYADGHQEQRVWRLTPQAGGRWQGRAPDVKGVALGEVAGNALRWQYTLQLSVDGRRYEVQLDDWMYLIDPCTMINRTSMRKLGIEVGQVTLIFRKPACAI